MIGGEAQIHQRLHGHLAVFCYRRLDNCVYAQYRHFRLIDDWSERFHPVHSQVGNRECASRHIARSKPVISRFGNQFLHFLRHFAQPFAVGMLDNRNDQTFIQPDGNSDVYIISQY
ncbi:hypothetical protein D3C80_1507580 [compost metagenome]